MNENVKEIGKLLLASIVIPVAVQVLSQLAIAWQQKLLDAAYDNTESS